MMQWNSTRHISKNYRLLNKSVIDGSFNCRQYLQILWIVRTIYGKSLAADS
jgi:hypothetical protein